MRSQGQISLNFSYHVNFKDYLPNFVRVLTNKRKYFEQIFYSVAGDMPQGWTLGVLGSKTLALEFAMAPHRLRILVHFCSNSNRTFSEQTLETLIRRRIQRCLVLVCVVCLCRTKRTLSLYGLNLSACQGDLDKQGRPRSDCF